MKNNIIYYITFIYIILIACKNDDDTSKSTESFDLKTLLQSEVDAQILPAVSGFVNATNTMEASVQSYLSQTTEINLTNVKQQWKAIAIAYEKIYAFNIGEVRSQFIHFSIYNWPVTPIAIENNISNNTIDENFMDTVPASLKSIAALEYLLFRAPVSETNFEIANSENRKNYIKFSALFLKIQAEKLQNIWLPSGSNYANTFVNNTETGIRSSFNIFYNGLYNSIDTGKVTKIGKPAGLEKSDVIDPELTQALFSDTSLTLIRTNIESIEQIYFNTSGALGIDDYVFFITQSNTLNDLVTNKIDAVINAIDNISLPLDQAISVEPELVGALYKALDELRILFAVDLLSRLSLIITSTDNDGD